MRQIGVGTGQSQQWPRRVPGRHDAYQLPFAVTVDGKVVTYFGQAVTISPDSALTINGIAVGVRGQGVTVGDING